MITSSVLIENFLIKDGRRFVRERHTDHLGKTYDYTYLIGAEVDVNVRMINRVPLILEKLKRRELDTNLNAALNDKPLTFEHCTVADFRQVVREKFKELSAWDLVRLGRFINTLSLTNIQLMNLFNINSTQLTILKARLALMEERYDEIIALIGE